MCKTFSGNDTTAREKEETHSPSPRLNLVDLTVQEMREICTVIIGTLVEHVTELSSDVSEGEEETEV